MTILLRPEHVRSAAAELFGFTEDELTSGAKTKPLMIIRHACIYVARQETMFSLSVIGKEFGLFDHTSVRNAVQRTKDRIAEDGDPQVRKWVEALTEKVRA